MTDPTREERNVTPTPVFSGGTGKSGTTIMGKLLGHHPAVLASRPREVRFVTGQDGLLHLCYGPSPTRGRGRVNASLRSRLRGSGGGRTDSEALAAFTEQVHGRWWDRPTPRGEARGLRMGIEPADLDRIVDQFVRDFPGDHEGASRAFLFGYIRHQRGFAEQAMWIDTTPRNVEDSPRILRLFPEARFILMLREGRDTALSLTQQAWGPNEPIEALRWWADRLERTWLALCDLPEAAVLRVHLEDLVVHARDETLARTLDFLSLTETPSIRTFFERRMPADRVELGKWRRLVPDPGRFDEEYQRLVAGLRERGVPDDLLT